jgi:chloramphenicol 3-O-phosphotransferase
MATERLFNFDLSAEVDRPFDDSSNPTKGPPVAVILMGGVCAGKTSIRKQKYSGGYVLIDAADIFLSLSRDESFPFPEAFQEPMNLIGRLITRRALSERRNIVTEIIGADAELTHRLIDALKRIGYRVKLVAIHCEPEEGMRRNASRSEDNISAYYAEPFQRTWIIDACNELANGVAESSSGALL